MADLGRQIEQGFRGNVCLMGIGNADYGDDGLGLGLAEALKKALGPGGRPPGDGLEVIVAGAEPEYFIGRVEEKAFDHLVFLDAVEFGGAPGSVVLLDSEEISARFPQVSTHKISLGFLAKRIEAGGTTKAWLLGVQPESLKGAQRLTPTVQKTLEALTGLLCRALGRTDVENQQRGAGEAKRNPPIPRAANTRNHEKDTRGVGEAKRNPPQLFAAEVDLC